MTDETAPRTHPRQKGPQIGVISDTESPDRVPVELHGTGGGLTTAVPIEREPSNASHSGASGSKFLHVTTRRKGTHRRRRSSLSSLDSIDSLSGPDFNRPIGTDGNWDNRQPSHLGRTVVEKRGLDRSGGSTASQGSHSHGRSQDTGASPSSLLFPSELSTGVRPDSRDPVRSGSPVNGVSSRPSSKESSRRSSLEPSDLQRPAFAADRSLRRASLEKGALLSGLVRTSPGGTAINPGGNPIPPGMAPLSATRRRGSSGSSRGSASLSNLPNVSSAATPVASSSLHAPPASAQQQSTSSRGLLSGAGSAASGSSTNVHGTVIMRRLQAFRSGRQSSFETSTSSMVSDDGPLGSRSPNPLGDSGESAHLGDGEGVPPGQPVGRRRMSSDHSRVDDYASAGRHSSGALQGDEYANSEYMGGDADTSMVIDPTILDDLDYWLETVEYLDLALPPALPSEATVVMIYGESHHEEGHLLPYPPSEVESASAHQSYGLDSDHRHNLGRGTGGQVISTPPRQRTDADLHQHSLPTSNFLSRMAAAGHQNLSSSVGSSLGTPPRTPVSGHGRLHRRHATSPVPSPVDESVAGSPLRPHPSEPTVSSLHSGPSHVSSASSHHHSSPSMPNIGEPVYHEPGTHREIPTSALGTPPTGVKGTSFSRGGAVSIHSTSSTTAIAGADEFDPTKPSPRLAVRTATTLGRSPLGGRKRELSTSNINAIPAADPFRTPRANLQRPMVTASQKKVQDKAILDIPSSSFLARTAQLSRQALAYRMRRRGSVGHAQSMSEVNLITEAFASINLDARLTDAKGQTNDELTAYLTSLPTPMMVDEGVARGEIGADSAETILKLRAIATDFIALDAHLLKEGFCQEKVDEVLSLQAEDNGVLEPDNFVQLLLIISRCAVIVNYMSFDPRTPGGGHGTSREPHSTGGKLGRRASFRPRTSDGSVASPRTPDSASRTREHHRDAPGADSPGTKEHVLNFLRDKMKVWKAEFAAEAPFSEPASPMPAVGRHSGGSASSALFHSPDQERLSTAASFEHGVSPHGSQHSPIGGRRSSLSNIPSVSPKVNVNAIQRQASDVQLSRERSTDHVGSGILHIPEGVVEDLRASSAAGSAGSRTPPLDLLCRICEEVVPANQLESHSKRCAIQSKVISTATSCDERMTKIISAMKKRMSELKGKSGFGTLHQGSSTSESKTSPDSAKANKRFLEYETLKSVKFISECVRNLFPDSADALKKAQTLMKQLDEVRDHCKMDNVQLDTYLQRVYELAKEKEAIIDVAVSTAAMDEHPRKLPPPLRTKKPGYLQTPRRPLSTGGIGTVIPSSSSEPNLAQIAAQHVPDGSEDNSTDGNGPSRPIRRSTNLGSRPPSGIAGRPSRSRSMSRRSSLHSTMPSIKDFKIIKPINKGAFGRVFLCKKRLTGDLFAIKILKKSDMILKNQVDHVLAERNILAHTSHTFVVKMYYAFQDKHNLYLVMEYLNGGDCYALLDHMGYLEEPMARQYIAETVLALEYLHNSGIVHRDLKPDNMLISKDGHIKLTDFGLSRIGLMDRHSRAPTGASRRTGDSSKEALDVPADSATSPPPDKPQVDKACSHIIRESSDHSSTATTITPLVSPEPSAKSLKSELGKSSPDLGSPVPTHAGTTTTTATDTAGGSVVRRRSEEGRHPTVTIPAGPISRVTDPLARSTGSTGLAEKEQDVSGFEMLRSPTTHLPLSPPLAAALNNAAEEQDALSPSTASPTTPHPTGQQGSSQQMTTPPQAGGGKQGGDGGASTTTPVSTRPVQGGSSGDGDGSAAPRTPTDTVTAAPGVTPATVARSAKGGANKQERRLSVVGTPDYLAPEILLGKGHGPSVDWWSLGIILFEFLTSCPPFNDATPDAIFANILRGQIPWPEEDEIPISPEAKDLIVSLLQLNPKKRLGANGAKEVKDHPFFKGVEWDTILERPAAFVPKVSNESDTSYFAPRGHIEQFDDPTTSSDSSEKVSPPSSTSASSLTDPSSSNSSDSEDMDMQETAQDKDFLDFSFKNVNNLAELTAASLRSSTSIDNIASLASNSAVDLTTLGNDGDGSSVASQSGAGSDAGGGSLGGQLSPEPSSQSLQTPMNTPAIRAKPSEVSEQL